MSADEERDLQVGAAVLRAGCFVLSLRREVFRFHHGNPIVNMHREAMNEALVRLKVPYLARLELLGPVVHVGEGCSLGCPFFAAMVDFYFERVAKVDSAE